MIYYYADCIFGIYRSYVGTKWFDSIEVPRVPCAVLIEFECPNQIFFDKIFMEYFK